LQEYCETEACSLPDLVLYRVWLLITVVEI